MNHKSPVVNFIVPTFFDMNGNNMLFGGAERYLLELIRLVRSMEYEKMAQSVNPYGDGHAAQRIVDSILGCS